jgi:hypothetical protein
MKKIAGVFMAAVLAAVLAISVYINHADASTAMTRATPGGNRSSYWYATGITAGTTSSISDGTSIDVLGIQTITVHVVEGGTTSFVIQVSFDGCSTYQTLDTFTATTTKPYRDLWADCVRVNTSWTAGAQAAYIRGR